MWLNAALPRKLPPVFSARSSTFVRCVLVLICASLLYQLGSFIYTLGVKAGSQNATFEAAAFDVGFLTNRIQESGQDSISSEKKWRDLWTNHAPTLSKSTRLKTLLDAQRKLLKPPGEPGTEFQPIAGVQILLAQSLSELDAATGIEQIQAWVKQEVTKQLEREFLRLQFPEDCNRARKMVCTLDKSCGFGCQVHHIVHCFANAVAANRTLVLRVHPWRYTPTGHWNDVFLPVTDCPPPPANESWQWPNFGKGNNFFEDSPTVYMNMIDVEQTVYDPPAMPFDVQQAVRLFHARPEVWWVGVLAKLLLRPSEASVRRQGGLGFKPGAPVVGVHIRRTDKVAVGEAHRHEVAEYMGHAERFCDSRLPSGWQTRARENLGNETGCYLYLATDERAVLEEVKGSYPHIDLLNGDNVTALAASVAERSSFDSLLGIFDDVMHLASTDYLVGTLSSQVSRLAYEIMQTRISPVDASFTYQSLDSVWYYGGQLPGLYCLISDFTDKGNAVMHKGDALKCDVIVRNVGGELECRSERSQDLVHVPAGLIDWCPEAVKEARFRDLLPSYMSSPQS